MKKWKVLNGKTKRAELNDQISNHIVTELAFCLDGFFAIGNEKRTEAVKVALTRLGRKLNYKVEANRLPLVMRQSHGGEEKNTEWLYDLHWYEEVESDDYLPTRLNLVVECEWEAKRKDDKIVPFSGIKYDFQKLLVANADLRLMIFRIRKRDKENALDELNKYFTKAIKSYQNLARNSKFLFVAFDESKKQIRYTEKSNGQKNSNRNHAVSE